MRRGKQVFSLAFPNAVASPDAAWMEKSESALCVICHSPFQLWTKWKHHCRLCGRLVCASCSPHRAYIDKASKRTCRLCGDVLHMLQALGDARVHSKAGKPSPLFFQQPHPADEYSTIMAISHAALRSDLCYIISASWLSRWLAYVTAGGDHPGAIANHSLLSFHRGQLLPKPDLPLGAYHTIHPDVWKVFQHYYGGGPSISVVGTSKAWNIHLRPTEVFGHCWFPMDDDDNDGVHERPSVILRHLVVTPPLLVVPSTLAARYHKAPCRPRDLDSLPTP
ncbi:hypothetical protein SPRG_07513, partial [Saprolegnia parasitica CBS 223.65]